MINVSILDGYVDEPTCLGVPPYMSPYPRYIAGAVWNHDPRINVMYFTIDQIRNDQTILRYLRETDLLLVVAGTSVPGRYLAGFPVSPNEIQVILRQIPKPVKLLCGPAARYGFGMGGGKKTRDLKTMNEVFDGVITGDSEVVITDLLNHHLDLTMVDFQRKRMEPSDIRRIAVKGAALVKQHPFYPHHLITEIETYRGCPRSITGGCSFCSEPFHGAPRFRSIEDIHDEVNALYVNGIRHIRLGSQPCIFSYMAHHASEQEFPRPNPSALEKLFKGIRVIAPDLKTFHVDNANPGVIARYPDECEQIAETIIRYHTSGDVAAFGVESVDPRVIKESNLKATAEQVFEAVKLLNNVGGERGANGMPEFLPGLNFLFGLKGETRETFHLNYEFLKKIVHNHLLIRRINIRQIIPIPGTPMYEIGNKLIKKHKALFHHFKKIVRETIEQPLLQTMVPKGTVLTEVITEKTRGKVTFGRQMGSYPLLIGIPGKHPLQQSFQVKVTDHGYRSITAVPYPVPINTAPREIIEALPGVGQKRVIRILSKRPFKGEKEFLQVLDDSEIGRSLLPFLTFEQ